MSRDYTINCYVTLDRLKDKLGIATTTTDDDVELLQVCGAASRAAEGYTGRRFYVETATKYFTPKGGSTLYLGGYDLQSVTTLKTDEDNDYTYETTWTEGTDFTLLPRSHYPKDEIQLLPDSTKYWPTYRDCVEITGSWGSGDLRSSSPWEALGITGTVATTTGTTLVVSAATNIAAGQTLLVESEQMFVTGVSSTNVTVVRGVNGTTAATHSAAAVSLAIYPEDVVRGTMWLAVESWKLLTHAGYESERIGQYSYKIASDVMTEKIRKRMFGRVAKGVFI